MSRIKNNLAQNEFDRSFLSAVKISEQCPCENCAIYEHQVFLARQERDKAFEEIVNLRKLLYLASHVASLFVAAANIRAWDWRRNFYVMLAIATLIVANMLYKVRP